VHIWILFLPIVHLIFKLHCTAAILCGSSNHHFILTHFCARSISQCSEHNVISFRQYYKLDIELLDKVLLDESWSLVFDVVDINVCTEAFTIVLKYVSDTLEPLHRLRVKRSGIPLSHSQDITSARRQRD